MALRIHDPGHVALRRAIRAAIGVPIAVGVALLLLPGTPCGLIAAFGSLGLIATCDFGGSTRRRLASLLGAAAVGTLVITIGVFAGLTLVTAVLITFVVGTILAFAAVLHGSIASGAPAMTVVYVAATTIGVPLNESWTLLAGWAIAVAVAIPVSLLILPRRNVAPVRQACAEALAVLADAAKARGQGRDLDISAIDAARVDLQKSYLGNPFRASGLNQRDRSLIVLVGQLQALLAAFVRSRTYAMPPTWLTQTHELTRQAELAFAAASKSLVDSSAPEPSGLAVAQAWQDQWGEAMTVLASDADGDVAHRVDTVYSMFPDRATAISAVRATILVRRVLGLAPEDFPRGPGLHSIPEPPVSEGRQELKAEATLRSPWARLALRTGVGLALAVLVVYITGLAHGFWVVLGVTAILRFDGLTTVKMAGQAVVGTVIGAIAGYFVLLLDMQHFAWLWIGLVLATFIAVWAQGAINFIVGQAAFSMFVIIGFSVLSWPPNLDTAAERVQNITIGAVVSVIIALLLWPRGVLRGRLANVAAAIRASNRLLAQAVSAIVNGPHALDPRVLTETTGAILRSQEVIDLSLSSTNSGGAQFAYQWQTLIDELRTPIVAGHLLSDWAGDGPPLAEVAPALGETLEGELHSVTSAWDGLADEIDGQGPASASGEPDALADIAHGSADLDLNDPVIADRVVAAIWTHAWLLMSLHAAKTTAVPASSPGH